MSFNYAKLNEDTGDQETGLEKLDRHLLKNSFKLLSPKIKQTKKSYEPL